MSYFRHKDAAFFKREKEQHENTSWYVALCILTLNSFYDITPKQKKKKKEREKREDRKKRNKTKKGLIGESGINCPDLTLKII